MKNAIIAATVAAVVAAASGTAATIVVTSANIKDGTIQTVDLSAKAQRALRGQRGLRGAAGAPGAQGVQGLPGAQGVPGAQGPPGIQSLRKVLVSIEVPAGDFKTLTADCPGGETAISGAFAFPAEVWESQQGGGGRGWTVTGFNYDPVPHTLYATAFCAPNVAMR